MQNYNGKYRKQPQKQKHIMTGIVGTVLVLSLFAIAFYKLGERSARESQEPVSETAALIQETYTEPPSTTEATTVVTTEAATAPIETTAAPLMQTQPTVAPTVSSTQTGTVLHSVDVLNVRSGAGTNYGIIRRLPGGETVTIYEQQYADGMTWGNIGYGWVSMNYIVFGADGSQAQAASVQHSQAQTGTVLRSTDLLNVRSGAGMSYGIIRRLQGGETVTVYEQQYADGMTWGNIGDGWVSMDYIVFGEDNSVAPESQKADYFGDWISGVQQNPAEQSGMRGFSDNAVCDKVFASFKKKIQGGYSGAEILYHSSSYSDGYVTYDPGRCTYSCSMTAQYCSNIFDMWGTSTSTYFVTAELAEKNGSLVLTKMDIK